MGNAAKVSWKAWEHRSSQSLCNWHADSHILFNTDTEFHRNPYSLCYTDRNADDHRYTDTDVVTRSNVLQLTDVNTDAESHPLY
jgi:hypothetical protein